jgi:Methyltransferase domain
VAPTGPVPFAPEAPVTPGAPVGPAAPVDPAGPVAPGAPVPPPPPPRVKGNSSVGSVRPSRGLGCNGMRLARKTTSVPKSLSNIALVRWYLGPMPPEYAAFLERTISEIKACVRDDDVLGRALSSDRLIRSGTWVEFGVAGGGTLRQIVAGNKGAHVWGLDSFDGLPTAWHIESKGAYAQKQPPSVPGANLIVGLFEDTLPSFHPTSPVTLAHVDCDIYPAAKTALQWLWGRVIPGSIVVFDEIWAYPTFAEHEMLALYEVSGGTGYDWVFASATPGAPRAALVLR